MPLAVASMRAHSDGIRVSIPSSVRELGGNAVLPDHGQRVRSIGLRPGDIDVASGEGHGMRDGAPSSICEFGGDAVFPDHSDRGVLAKRGVIRSAGLEPRDIDSGRRRRCRRGRWRERRRAAAGRGKHGGQEKAGTEKRS